MIQYLAVLEINIIFPIVDHQKLHPKYSATMVHGAFPSSVLVDQVVETILY